MKIELVTGDGVFTIHKKEEIVYLPSIVESLVAPVLLSAGFHPDSVVDSFAQYVEEHNYDEE